MAFTASLGPSSVSFTRSHISIFRLQFSEANVPSVACSEKYFHILLKRYMREFQKEELCALGDYKVACILNITFLHNLTQGR